MSNWLDTQRVVSFDQAGNPVTEPITIDLRRIVALIDRTTYTVAQFYGAGFDLVIDCATLKALVQQANP